MIGECELIVFGDRDKLRKCIDRELDKLKGSVFSYNFKGEYIEWPNQDRKYFMELPTRDKAFGKVSGMRFSKITLDVSLQDIDVVHYLLTRLRGNQ